MYGQAKRDRNPDDKITETVSSGKDAKLSLNTNGTIYFKDKSWLKNIKYALSGSYTDKKSHYEELYTAANAPYSMTTVDGAVITNKPGLDLYDVDGKKITDYTHVNPYSCLPPIKGNMIFTEKRSTPLPNYRPRCLNDGVKRIIGYCSEENTVWRVM